MNKKVINNLTFAELENELTSFNVKKFRTQQIYQWIFQKGVASFDEMTNLSKDFREQLKENYDFFGVETVAIHKSADRSEKYLFRLPKDQETVEAVFMPWEKRNTICLSSQVGCKMNCSFCATGQMGFTRNLEAYEIVQQVMEIKKSQGDIMLPSNLVFMGMGEPLDNYENVVKAINILNENLGLKIAMRKITVSTCGLVNNIYRLADEKKQLGLAISLNATNDEKRDIIMPVNKKFPIKELLEAAKYYDKTTGRRVTFEYVLLKDFNDNYADAEELAKILDFPCKINLIPYNGIEKGIFKRPSRHRVMLFQNKLYELSKNAVTLRESRGGDVEAACGQLKQREDKKDKI